MKSLYFQLKDWHDEFELLKGLRRRDWVHGKRVLLGGDSGGFGEDDGEVESGVAEAEEGEEENVQLQYEWGS